MKIRITHNPAGGESRSWELDPDDTDNLEAEAIEIVGGEAWDSYGGWLALIARGNMRAIRALLWVLYRRTDPDLDFNQVRFRTSEIVTEPVDDEEPGKEEAGDSDTGSPPLNTDSAAS